MKKRIRFYNPHEDNKICEGVLEKDPMFAGGYKVTYQNTVTAIKFLKVVEDE